MIGDNGAGVNTPAAGVVRAERKPEAYATRSGRTAIVSIAAGGLRALDLPSGWLTIASVPVISGGCDALVIA